LRSVIGKNFIAPISGLHLKVLDVGCSTGVWLLEMAHECPQWEFTGVDTAERSAWPTLILPSNCRFDVCETFDALEFAGGEIDYIHHRLLATSIPEAAYMQLLSSYHRVLAVGGYLEICDTDYRFNRAGEVGNRVKFWIRRLAAARGIDLSVVKRLEPELKQHFDLVQSHVVSFPLGEWGESVFEKGIGRAALTNAIEMVKVLKERLLQESIAVEEEVDDVIQRWQAECVEMQTFLNVKIYIAKKTRD